MGCIAVDFLKSAKNCVDTDGEIYQRNAVSRAYYAAYRSSQCILPNDYLPKKGDPGGMHEKLIAAFNDYGRKPLPGVTLAKEIAVLLAQLKSARVKADYYLDLNIIDRPYAQTQIGVAEKLLLKIGQFSHTLEKYVKP